MTEIIITSAQAALMCNAKNCSAPYAQEVTLFEQDFRFCMHHYNELEPTLLAALEAEDTAEPANA